MLCACVCVPEEQRRCQRGLGFKTSVPALDQEILEGNWGQGPVWGNKGERDINRKPPCLETGESSPPAPGPASSLEEARNCRGGLGLAQHLFHTAV